MGAFQTMRVRDYDSPRVSDADVDTLTAQFADSDPVIRDDARESLVSLGTSKVNMALVAKLGDPRDQVRWEAAKALGSIADPMSAPALVRALEDNNSDVRWVASEGLVAIGKVGVLAVLNALTRRASSVTLCDGASRVLHGCSNYDNASILAPVLTALHDWEPGASVPSAAYDAIKALILDTGHSLQ
jgi:HEAT repeat protein